MIIIGGDNKYKQLSAETSMIEISPPQIIEIDENIISFSTYASHSAKIDNQGQLYIIGNDQKFRIGTPNRKIYSQYTKLQFEDIDERFISVHCGIKYTLYLTERNKLILCSEYDVQRIPRIFELATKPFYIFGGSKISAIVDENGDIYVINPCSIFSKITKKSPKDHIQSNLPLIHLHDKAQEVACCKSMLMTLTEKNQLYSNQIDKTGKILKEEMVLFPTLESDSDIVHISGTNDTFYALDSKGVTYFYSNNTKANKLTSAKSDSRKQFIAIESLQNFKVHSVYAGFDHSLLFTEDDEVLSIGSNKSKQLLVSDFKKSFSQLPLKVNLGEPSNYPSFAIAGKELSVVFLKFRPTNSPNQVKKLSMLFKKSPTTLQRKHSKPKIKKYLTPMKDEGEEKEIVPPKLPRDEHSSSFTPNPCTHIDELSDDGKEGRNENNEKRLVSSDKDGDEKLIDSDDKESSMNDKCGDEAKTLKKPIAKSGSDDELIPKKPIAKSGSDDELIPKKPIVKSESDDKLMPKKTIVKSGSGDEVMPKKPIVKSESDDELIPKKPIAKSGSDDEVMPKKPVVKKNLNKKKHEDSEEEEEESSQSYSKNEEEFSESDDERKNISRKKGSSKIKDEPALKNPFSNKKSKKPDNKKRIEKTDKHNVKKAQETSDDDDEGTTNSEEDSFDNESPKIKKAPKPEDEEEEEEEEYINNNKSPKIKKAPKPEDEEEDEEEEEEYIFDNKSPEIKKASKPGSSEFNQEEFERLRKENEMLKRMLLKESGNERKPKYIDSNELKDIEHVSYFSRKNTADVSKVKRIITKTEFYTMKTFKKENYGKFRKFLRHFEIQYSLHHPCVVKFFGFTNTVKDFPNPLLLVECLPYNLREVMNIDSSDDVISNTTKVEMIIDIAFGMQHLHKFHIVHRNLKPENILVSKKFHAKVADLAWADEFCEEDGDEEFALSKKKDVWNTYTAPEMIKGLNYHEKVDQFAFGKIVYFILNDGVDSPFCKADLNKGVTFKKVQSLNDYAFDLIGKCCSYSPAGRPPFSEILEFIENCNFNLLPDVDVDHVKNRIMKLKLLEDIYSLADDK